MALYNNIGLNYANFRVPDPRIKTILKEEVGNAKSVVNIGAGAGAYEPNDRKVIAVEPSEVMINQRPEGAAEVIQASAEDLPFEDQEFDLAIAILTIHHWRDLQKGLQEMKRVAKRQLIFTWDPEHPGFWMTQDYFPEILIIDQNIFPTQFKLEKTLGTLKSKPVLIPHDCTDGFACAYWRRPKAYLGENVRGAISTFSKISGLEEGVKRLREDLNSGSWDKKYGHLLQLEELDLGYRLFSTEVE